MKVTIYDTTKREIGKKELPEQFNEDVRPDLIKRAVLVIRNNKRQNYGAKKEAGKRSSVRVSKRRKDYRGSYGFGISRVPRKVLSGRGRRLNWQGAFAPGTVGGRRAHPPKAEKILVKKINKKERRKAIRSAMSATVLADLVKKRGHSIPDGYPFIVESEMESASKIKETLGILNKLGFSKELDRVVKRKIRSGKGKMRSRKYVTKKSLLMVVSKECKLINALKNIPGVDIVEVKNLNVDLLAPGANLGRLVLWTDKAIEILEKERLFLN